MDTYTRTRTHTLTHTYIDVRHVNWKVRSDLRYLRFMYSLFDENYEELMSGDLYKWVLAGYVSEIKFLFYTPSYVLQLGIRYKINSLGQVSRDDDAGNIPYVSLAVGTIFNVIVVPSDAWRRLSEQDKNNFYTRLSSGWGPSQLSVKETYGWNADNVYSSNSLSAQREIYRIP